MTREYTKAKAFKALNLQQINRKIIIVSEVEVDQCISDVECFVFRFAIQRQIMIINCYAQISNALLFKFIQVKIIIQVIKFSTLYGLVTSITSIMSVLSSAC